MGINPLHLLFVWHMHQPYYRDPSSGIYRLPWVRLHGIKDYYDMPALLESFPRIRQTFNLVPSLLDQIHDYVAGTARDHFLELSRTPAEELGPREREFILKNFFLANWDTMIRPYPRYFELLRKRDMSRASHGLRDTARFFTVDELRDLQVWFNLAWFDPVFRQEGSPLAALVRKGAAFTEEEKQQVLDYQMHVMEKIIPMYRDMSREGRIEISTTPYYHPILPLLWDSDVARTCMPWAQLPTRYSFPEDARQQVLNAVAFHTRCFGAPPRGMWPSEGSVSQDILGLFPEAGIRWIATDEAILGASLGRSLRDGRGHLSAPELLYRPYRVAGGTQVIFRDHELSDRIGFVYSRMNHRDAVNDFIAYLQSVRSALPDDRVYAVPVILDGENAWEWYPNDGRDFLRHLYERLSSEPGILVTTVSEYLENHPAETDIERLFPGSWINGNFSIWIGHEEDNLAWEHLRRARQVLAELEENNYDARILETARTSIHIAEGSDWCWWYGDEHATENQEEFDSLYRENLKQVYRLIGRGIPPELNVSILRKDQTVPPLAEPRSFISPRIDGEITDYFEWLAAGCVNLSQGGGAMHEAEQVAALLYYGFDADTLFLRLDPPAPGARPGISFRIVFNVLAPQPRRIVVDATPGKTAISLHKPFDGDWLALASNASVAIKDILECAVPFVGLGARPREVLTLFLAMFDESGEIGRYPGKGLIAITVPPKDFDALMWQ